MGIRSLAKRHLETLSLDHTGKGMDDGVQRPVE